MSIDFFFTGLGNSIKEGIRGKIMSEMSKDNFLRSWKDISVYLGCDTRTCHRWEKKHGMPMSTPSARQNLVTGAGSL